MNANDLNLSGQRISIAAIIDGQAILISPIALTLSEAKALLAQHQPFDNTLVLVEIDLNKTVIRIVPEGE